MRVLGCVAIITQLVGGGLSANNAPYPLLNVAEWAGLQHPSIRAEQEMVDIVRASSNLVHLIKTGVKQLLKEVHTGMNSQTLTWYDSYGGLGNQLGGLSGALIMGACTGRRVQLGERQVNSISRWLWHDYFKLPFRNWIVRNKTDSISGHFKPRNDVTGMTAVEMIQVVVFL